jgi:hypothetical protein
MGEDIMLFSVRALSWWRSLVPESLELPLAFSGLRIETAQQHLKENAAKSNT